MSSFADVIRKIELLQVGTPIPKPRSTDNSYFIRWGERRSERALIYTMPNHKNPAKPHQKGVTISEFQRAWSQLYAKGGFSRNWFNTNLPDCRREGSCNFTTIGGIFQVIGIARYEAGRARYLPITP